MSENKQLKKLLFHSQALELRDEEDLQAAMYLNQLLFALAHSNITFEQCSSNTLSQLTADPVIKCTGALGST